MNIGDKGKEHKKCLLQIKEIIEKDTKSITSHISDLKVKMQTYTAEDYYWFIALNAV